MLKKINLVKRFSIVLVFLILALNGYGQKVVRNEVDKYTKDKIKETSYEDLAVSFQNLLRFKIRMVNDSLFIVLRTSMNSPFRIDEDNYVYLLLDSDESIKLRCVKGQIAEHIAVEGALWTSTSKYSINDSQVRKILQANIVGIRVDIGDAYLEFDKIKANNSDKLKKALNLMQ